MSAEDRRQPRTEPAPRVDTSIDNKLTFFMAAIMCATFGISGIKEGNEIGGLIALGMGAMATLAGLRA